jgi:hypothetical protein
MANPNIAAVTDIKGKMAYAVLTESSAQIVLNSNSSNQLYKISSISVANKSSQSSSVFLLARRDSVEYELASGIVIPERSTVIIIDKNNPIYLEEGDSVRSYSSVNNTLVLTITYEILE